MTQKMRAFRLWRKHRFFESSHRPEAVSPVLLALWFERSRTEGLLHGTFTALRLDVASKAVRGGDGPNQVEPEVLYRRRGNQSYRHLPGPPSGPRAEQASRHTGARCGSCRRRSREVAIHEFGPDDSHGPSSALPTLRFIPSKTGTHKAASRATGRPLLLLVALRKPGYPEIRLTQSKQIASYLQRKRNPV